MIFPIIFDFEQKKSRIKNLKILNWEFSLVYWLEDRFLLRTACIRLAEIAEALRTCGVLLRGRHTRQWCVEP